MRKAIWAARGSILAVQEVDGEGLFVIGGWMGVWAEGMRVGDDIWGGMSEGGWEKGAYVAIEDDLEAQRWLLFCFSLSTSSGGDVARHQWYVRHD